MNHPPKPVESFGDEDWQILDFRFSEMGPKKPDFEAIISIIEIRVVRSKLSKPYLCPFRRLTSPPACHSGAIEVA